MHYHFPLRAYNTFAVDAFAKYFVEVTTIDELKEALQFSNSQDCHSELVDQSFHLILGGGSNVLFTKDFEGLVIHLNLKGISEETLNENEILVTAKAGENWHRFVEYCLEKNYGGLENLSLIPGNVGTSPIQNIGAYGTEIKNTFVSCRVVDVEKLNQSHSNQTEASDCIEIFDLEKCQFGYRDSVFKRNKGKYIILDVTFKLSRKNHQLHREYGAIQSELQKLNIDNPTIQDISRAVISIRESKLPNPKEIGNAGSFFKNPTIPLKQFEVLKLKFENIQGYPNGNYVKVPAGWLIEQCGWKGKQIGNVATHHLQSLVIINKTGKATGKEIFDFSEKIIQSVEEKFGILLEREVNIV